MVGNNLKDTQLQQIVDKTILFADKDDDGKINFEEFCTVRSVSKFAKFSQLMLCLLAGCWKHRYPQENGC